MEPDKSYIVTDKQYYLDKNLANMIKLMSDRVDNNWDNCWIIDGKEGAGKSHLARAIGYYYAYIRKIPFSVENVHFDPEEIYKYATTHEKSIIIWDEATFGGMSLQWQSKIQQRLIQMMMVTRKYNHFYILIMPSFFKVNRYLATHRSLALINVYSPDMLTRGYFKLFNEKQKVWIYNNNQKAENYGFGMKGRFTAKNQEHLLDLVAYEKKKDSAIKKMVEAESEKGNKQEGKYQMELRKIKRKLCTEMDYSTAKEYLGLTNRNHYYYWKKWTEFNKATEET